MDSDEIVADPNEKIDFDEGLPSTSSRPKNPNAKVHIERKAGQRYRETIDFEEGLPVAKAKVTIAKRAEAPTPEEVAEVEAAPVRVHSSTGVENRVSTVEKAEPKPRVVKAPTVTRIKPRNVGRAKVITTKSATVEPTTEILPEVLSWEAVRSGAMPKLGASALPESLEQDVPPKFRFWKCGNLEDATAVRDALVESQIFGPKKIRKVNGEVRRAVVETVEKLFLAPSYDSQEPIEVPGYVRPVEKVAGLLSPVEGDKETVLFDEDIVSVVGIETIVEKAGSLLADFVIAAHDSPEVRKAIGGPAFKLKSRDDLVFATNAPLESDDLIDWVQLERADEILKFAFSDGRKIPLLKAEEERIVYGVVLEPDEIDAQDDTVTKKEIEQACHKFMEDFGGLGRQHKELVNGKLVLLENFIAPVDFEVDGQMVKAGSWLMKERVVDDELWIAVKKGEYTGYSIGGSAVRTPV
jgi:putative serine protease XkdF